MNVKLKVLSAGVLFFLGQVSFAQKQKKDTITKEKKIEEVVILGYSKTALKAKDVTATTTVSAETIENRPNVSVLQSLQGTAPGLSVSTSSGSPGSSKIDVIIRGVSSLNSISDPLYVIDGMISNATQYRNLNPNDIESVSILKDAAGTSIYGNRGANGVIIIKTKQAKYGTRFDIGYSATTGVSFLPEAHYNMANSQQILKIEKNYGNGGLGVTMTDQQIQDFKINTNWRDVFFRNGFTQNHDVSLTVGGENINNYTSFGYMEQSGIVPTSDFKRFTLRDNINGRSKNERFNYGLNLALGYSKRNQLDQETNGNITNNTIQNPLHGSFQGLPYLQAGIYPNGQALYNAIGTNFNTGYGVYVLEDILKGTLPNLLNETSTLTNLSASYKLTKDLTVANKSGIDYKYSERTFARAPWSYLAIAVAKGQVTTAVPNPFGGFEAISKNTEFNFNSITSLNYHKEIGEKHTFDLGAYLDYLKVDYRGTAQQQNGLNPLNYVFGAGSGYVAFDVNNPTYYRPTLSATHLKAGTLAYFATLDYDYAGKYGLSGLVRRDGTYRFVGDKKWATFWMAAGRWNIDKEAFMSGSTFDLLKLRGSYGIQGNQNIGGAAYGVNPLLANMNLVRDTNLTGLGYNNANPAYYTGVIANSNVQWEEVGQLDLGLDFRFLNRKIEGSFDYYKKKTNQLYNTINVSAITSLYGINGNNGSLQNEGIEMLLKYNIVNKENARLSIFANAAHNTSKILSLIKDDTSGSIRNVVGGMYSEWYMIPYVGVNADNGNLLFKDKNGNVTENPDQVADAVKTGKNYLPKWEGGFGLNSEYKGFFLDTNFTFQWGAWKYDNQMDWNYDPTSIGGQNLSADLLNAWTPTNINTNIPSLTAGNTAFVGSSDRFLRDASFIRLKTITFGYSVPKSLLQGTFVKNLKVFVLGENLITWTKWKGLDPEPAFPTTLDIYPNMKTASLGVNIDF